MSAAERRKIVLGSEGHRQTVGALVAAMPPGSVVTIDPPRRTLPQNSRLYALLSDIAASGFEWAGCRRTVDELKVLFVSAHALVEGRHQEVIPGFEDEPVALRESTAAMSKERLGSLMDYIEAFAAQRGIRLSGPEYDR
jgi:hypothetical protein